MLEKIAAVFPRRPLRIKKHGIQSPLLLLLGLIFFGALTAWTLMMNTPGIIKDMQIAQDMVERPELRVRNGTCKTWKLGLTRCEVTIRHSIAGKVQDEELELSFFDFGGGNYSVSVVGSRSQPDLVTLDLGIEELWNRIFTAAIIVLLLGILTMFSIYGLVSSTAIRRKIGGLNHKTLHPVPVEIVKENSGVVVYRYDVGGKKRKVNSRFGKNSPFYLSADGETGLGVTDEYGDCVVLLDEDLKRIDFTDAEREAIWNAAGWGKAA